MYESSYIRFLLSKVRYPHWGREKEKCKLVHDWLAHRQQQPGANLLKQIEKRAVNPSEAYRVIKEGSKVIYCNDKKACMHIIINPEFIDWDTVKNPASDRPSCRSIFNPTLYL